MSTAVLIPVKSFDAAKGRLAETLTPEARSNLAQAMASQVVAAARPLPTYVVCDDDEVAAWAVEAGASVIWRPANGLNDAVTKARDALRSLGFERLIVAHGDLPFATALAWVDHGHGVTILTDRRQDGTNVLALPLDVDFVFAYGAGSANNHQLEAARLGLTCNLIHDERLGWDVDTPEDLVGAERPIPGLIPDVEGSQ
ncbi:MAG: 2-phospho-L-lactate guanylyltransferase [Acidimicrobiales bacterium]